MPKAHAVERMENRIPIAVGVQIAGHKQLPGVEQTFTENVSSRGARVLTVRRWRTNDRLLIATLRGDFHSLARVAYCQPASAGPGFAIGLEFLESTGNWVISPPGGTGESPHTEGGPPEGKN